jgi:hypothetical protein
MTFIDCESYVLTLQKISKYESEFSVQRISKNHLNTNQDFS